MSAQHIGKVEEDIIMVKKNGLEKNTTGPSRKRRDKPPLIEKVAQWLADYRLPLAAAREVHARIDAGGLGGKIVLLPWGE